MLHRNFAKMFKLKKIINALQNLQENVGVAKGTRVLL